MKLNRSLNNKLKNRPITEGYPELEKAHGLGNKEIVKTGTHRGTFSSRPCAGCIKNERTNVEEESDRNVNDELFFNALFVGTNRWFWGVPNEATNDAKTAVYPPSDDTFNCSPIELLTSEQYKKAGAQENAKLHSMDNYENKEYGGEHLQGSKTNEDEALETMYSDPRNSFADCLACSLVADVPSKKKKKEGEPFFGNNEQDKYNKNAPKQLKVVEYRQQRWGDHPETREIHEERLFWKTEENELVGHIKRSKKNPFKLIRFSSSRRRQDKRKPMQQLQKEENSATTSSTSTFSLRHIQSNSILRSNKKKAKTCFFLFKNKKVRGEKEAKKRYQRTTISFLGESSSFAYEKSELLHLEKPGIELCYR